MSQKITNLLEEARVRIEEASRLTREVEVIEEVGEDYIINPEFEEIVKGVYEIEEAVQRLTNNRKMVGSLDQLKDYVSDKLKDFFREYRKQKKYEGDLMEVGYRVVRRKSITDEADERFKKIDIKPNTEAINEYMNATRDDDNPDGKVPDGVIIDEYEYISYKPVING